VHVNSTLPAALLPLCKIAHWVVWRWVERKGAWTKPPFQASAPKRPASHSDPETWATYETALAVAQGGAADGIGFALPDTSFDVVDLDHCRDPETGEIDAWADVWLHTANGAYVEVTPSGEGLRIITLGSGEEAIGRRWTVEDARAGAGIEIYRAGNRYITVTGQQIGDCTALPPGNGLLEQIRAYYDQAGGKYDYNDADKQGSDLDYDDVIEHGAPEGADVSAVFHSVIGHLHAKGLSIEEIVEELGRHSNGIGARYSGRLRQEVERSFHKWDEKIRIEPPPAIEPDEPDSWDGKDKRGRPRSTRTNARRAIRSLDIKCSYDVFHDRLLISGKTIRQRSNLDHTVLILCAKIHKAFGFDPGPKNTLDALVQLCLENEFDPVLDYLNALTWDGVPRLDKWTISYLGADDTELNREFGRLALIAAVRRVRRPGSKFDPIVVLEGPMGTKKSMAIEIMAGSDNFSDQTILGARDREVQELLAGVWLYEIAELSNIRRTEVEHIKAFASRTTDRARPAYGRTREDRQRRCVLFATTNNDAYLKEADRRFWPIKTTVIDSDALRRDRDQLWAEAAAREGGAHIVPGATRPMRPIARVGPPTGIARGR
jgi:hypothetical protein